MMDWLRKHLPGGGGDQSTPFIMGSDKWMGSTAQHKGEKADPAVYQPSVEEKEGDEDVVSPKAEMARSQSFAPPPKPSADIPRSVSMSSKSSMYPKVQQHSSESGRDSPSSSLYPKVYEGKSEEELAEEESDDAGAPLDPREECLVTIPNAIVHLVDEQQSPHLATGHFSLVRIAQKGNGIVVLVRVGENLHWPLLMDEPTVKLDPTNYFFSLPVSASMDEPNGSGTSEVLDS